ncbi:MAG: hypothetical protein Q9198_001914 [Flavoplaca austrocitrina]
MSWRAITKFFRFCEMLEGTDCIHFLIRPLISIAQTSRMSKLTLTSDLTAFLVPLIKSLASELPAVSDNLSRYQSLFREVLHHYIKDYVGGKTSSPKSLARNGNWGKCYECRVYRQGPTDCSSCKDCTALNDFLTAPDRSEWRYKAAEPGRKHLDRPLYNLDCRSYTDKSGGTPYTPVISKTDNSYREALKAWERRCTEAKPEIEGVGFEKFKMFLGEQYDSIMEQLSNVTLGKTISTDRQPLVPLATSTQNTKRAYDGVEGGPARKRARHVKIINLCYACGQRNIR